MKSRFFYYNLIEHRKNHDGTWSSVNHGQYSSRILAFIAAARLALKANKDVEKPSVNKWPDRFQIASYDMNWEPVSRFFATRNWKEA